MKDPKEKRSMSFLESLSFLDGDLLEDVNPAPSSKVLPMRRQGRFVKWKAGGAVAASLAMVLTLGLILSGLSSNRSKVFLSMEGNDLMNEMSNSYVPQAVPEFSIRGETPDGNIESAPQNPSKNGALVQNIDALFSIKNQKEQMILLPYRIDQSSQKASLKGQQIEEGIYLVPDVLSGYTLLISSLPAHENINLVLSQTPKKEVPIEMPSVIFLEWEGEEKMQGITLVFPLGVAEETQRVELGEDFYLTLVHQGDLIFWAKIRGAANFHSP